MSVPALLPMLEGVAWEAFDPGSAIAARKGQTTNPMAAIALEPGVLERLAADGLLQVLDLLWQNIPWGSQPSTTRRLNRHWVLHGRSTHYGTEANSLRVFFALDHLASVVRSKRLLEPGAAA